MATKVSSRLDPEIFRLPVQRIRSGYYSDAYFVYTKQLLEEEGHHPRVTMQVFQKHQSVLGGIDEAIAILKTCSGHSEDGNWIIGWDALEVHARTEAARPGLVEPVTLQLRCQRRDEARERFDVHGRIDVDHAGCRVARRVDRGQRCADRVPDQHGALEPGLDDRAVDRVGHAIERVLVERPAAAVAGQVERDRPLARRQRVEDRVPHVAVERQPV